MTHVSSGSGGRPDRSDAWHRGLDRRAVAGAALRILDEDGRSGLTMRGVARSLGVEAASLYEHVASKDDLLDAVLDLVLDGVTMPDTGPDARSALLAGFLAYRRALVAHPAIVLLMNERARFSRSQVRLVERSIELLESLGRSVRVAVDGHVTLVAYVLGFVYQEVARPVTTPADVIAESPTLRRALGTLGERSVDERFQVGLEIILAGVGVPAD